jgi:hypothetical protein
MIIQDLESKIRNLINRPRRQYKILQDTSAWNQLCSCLDVIGDTELAISAYYDAIPKNISETYLLVYGILQTLFLQQDAVRNLCEALALRYNPDPRLHEIREIRNESVGHPTKRDFKKNTTWNFISRATLSKNGFQLMVTSVDSNLPKFKNIDLLEIIKTQSAKVADVLSSILKSLEDEENEHKAKFMSQILLEIFPSTLGYSFSKISETIHGSMPNELGSGHLTLIKDIIEQFEEALIEREVIPANDFIKYDIDQLRYPISELEKYFNDQSQTSLTSEGAYIFLFFIEKHAEKLKELAIEIDENYSS